MALKKIIRKKTDASEELAKLAETLQWPDLEKSYPKKNSEPWRRYSPERLIAPLNQAASSAIEKATPSFAAQNELSDNLKKLSDWKQADEIFYQKSIEALKKLPSPQGSEFFWELTLKQLGDDLYILRVPRGYQSKESNEIIWQSASEKALALRGLLIYCESESESSFHLSSENAAFDLSLYGHYQEAASRLSTQLLYEVNAKESSGVCYHRSLQERDAHSRHGLYSIDAKTAKIFVQNHLEPHAEADYYGIHTGNHSHNDHDYQVHHVGSQSRSNILFKMALLDHAYGVFWGNTIIDPKTTGCEGMQSNKNLILGQGSRVDAIPKLEILAEDVAASHGSATGELSEEELFYIMSRGLSELEARNLLIRGFFEDLISKALGAPSDDPESARERLARRIREGIERQLKLETSK